MLCELSIFISLQKSGKIKILKIMTKKLPRGHPRFGRPWGSTVRGVRGVLAVLEPGKEIWVRQEVES